MIQFEGGHTAAPLRGGETVYNLRAATQPPSTNTKTKLDLTKAYQDFHKPSIAGCKDSINKLNYHIFSDFFV